MGVAALLVLGDTERAATVSRPARSAGTEIAHGFGERFL
jgi:hypothetical protein